MSGVDTLPLASAAAPGAALPATPTEARRWTEVALLTLLVAAGVTVALAGAARDAALNPVAVPTLPHWILGPLTSLAPSLSGAQAMIVIAAMGVSYVGLLALGPTLSARRVLVAVAVLYVAFALTAPLISTDV